MSDIKIKVRGKIKIIRCQNINIKVNGGLKNNV